MLPSIKSISKIVTTSHHIMLPLPVTLAYILKGGIRFWLVKSVEFFGWFLGPTFIPHKQLIIHTVSAKPWDGCH